MGIRWWSPTQLLAHRFEACVWQSGRDAQFSSIYGRMYPWSTLNALYTTSSILHTTVRPSRRSPSPSLPLRHTSTPNTQHLHTFAPSHLRSFTPSLLLILFVAVDLLQRCRCRCPLPVRIPPYPHHASDLALAEARRSSRALPNASRLPAPDSSPIQGTRVARTGCSLRTDGQSFDVVLLRRRLCE